MANAITDSVSSLFEGPSNLSLTERALYVAGGLGLAAAGAKPRPNPLLNVLALAGGAYLVWRGAVGQCPVKAALIDHGGREMLSSREAPPWSSPDRPHASSSGERSETRVP